MKNNKCCLHPEHTDRKALSRGLCSSCYGAAMRLVKLKKTTWKQLEATGRVLPVSKRKGYGSSILWLLEGDKNAKP